MGLLSFKFLYISLKKLKVPEWSFQGVSYCLWQYQQQRETLKFSSHSLNIAIAMNNQTTEGFTSHAIPFAMMYMMVFDIPNTIFLNLCS